MTCLDQIIGLSQTECECLIDGVPTDYNESKSGIYMDKLPGFDLEVASGGEDCKDGNIWEIMAASLEEAKLDYKNQLLGCIGVNYKPRINSFHAQLGQITFKGNMSLTQGYCGQEIVPMQVKGGYFYINKVGIIINQATNVTFEIYSNENGSTLLYSSTPVATNANQVTWGILATPLELPMWSNSMREIKYYVLMIRNGSFQPKANKRDCGCVGKPKEEYLNWIKIYGRAGNDTSDFTNFTLTPELGGIVVDINVKCKTAEVICSDEYPPDFENDGNALSMAYALRFRADAIVYSKLLATGNLNRFTVADRESKFKQVDEWNGEFMKWVEYVCKNTNNITGNDCLICKEGQGTIIKRGIIVTKNTNHHGQYS